jgi:hypothetical protein
MTKRILFGLIVFLIVGSVGAFAEEMDPMGSTDAATSSAVTEPGMPFEPSRTPGRFTIGAETHLLFDKKMDPPETSSVDTLTVRRSDQFYVVPAVNVFRNEKTQIDLFGQLGAGSMRVTKGNKTSLIEETTSYDKGFLWGIGAKGSQKLWDNFKGHLSTRYKEFESDIDEYTYNGTKVQQLTGNTKGRLSEFETAFLISAAVSPEDAETTYNFYAGPSFIFTSYEQGAVSYLTGSTARTSEASDSDQRSSFGVMVGVDMLKFSEALKISFQANFFAETSVTLSLHYNF